MRKKINKILGKAEIVLGRKKLLALPRYVQLEPTSRCNQECIMCPRNEADYDSDFGDMSYENYLRVLDEIPTIENMQINGLGEPLLHPRIFDMIKEAKRRGITLSMNSNVIWVDTPKKAQKLVESGLDILKVSMDTTDSKVYDEIRQSDTYDKAVAAVKLIVQARGCKHEPQIWFNSVILQQNYKDIGNILKLGSELGVDLVRFKPVDTFDIYKDKGIKVASQEDLFYEMKKVLSEFRDVKVKHNLGDLINNFSNYSRPEGDYPCFSPWLEVYIQYYGGVRLCCEFYSKKYDVGNIFRENFKDIWNGEKMQKIRHDFWKGKLGFPVCATCNRFGRNMEIYKKVKKFRF